MNALTITIPTMQQQEQEEDMMHTPTANTVRAISCDQLHIKALLGCSDGVPGLMQSEHSMLCREFYSQSPQRLHMIAVHIADQMPTGSMVNYLGLQEEACHIMNSMYTPDTFEAEWNEFVAKVKKDAAISECDI